ncbi:phospholipid carrier-dependent glycosyltransferase [Streptosporangium sp. NPDC050855]|uniref:phospholipid carrier-dependent glycosyltransferase n=1 Tax=Streptosporangium sp. NPDC050855 TaxID=3366194 RepID=UPI0037994124
MVGWARLRRRFPGVRGLPGGHVPPGGHGSAGEQDLTGEQGSSAGRGLREHRWFLGLLGAGVVLRLVTVLGYRPALWFPDSYTYVVTALKPRPDLVRPAGYPMLLRLLEPFHDFAVVTVVQHLLGLLVGLLVYLTARRLGAPGWAAALASAPSLLDAYQIELEHLLVSDTLFTLLVVAATCLAVRGHTRSGGRIGRRTAAGIGLLLAAATLTRTVGLPLVALFAAWLIFRERGRVLAAGIMLAAAAVPILGYGAWFHATYQRIGIVGANGVFLYAKTMTFADCGVMRPPPDLAVLCDPRPATLRPPAQEYVWSQDSPLVRLPGITFTRENDALAGRFASLAIRSQPLAYLGSVASELARSFTVGRPVYPDQEIYDYYLFPATPPAPPGRYPATVGAQAAERYQRGPISTRIVEPYAGWMRTYQGVAGLPGAAVLVILLLPPTAACVRRFRPDSTAWALPWSVAAVLLVMPPAVAEFDYRYVLPAVPAACLAAALIVSKPKFRNIPLNVRI